MMYRRRTYTGAKGSALIISLVILVILCLSTIGILRHIHAIARINERSIARERVAIAAEAGLYKCIRFFAAPDDLLSIGGSGTSSYNPSSIGGGDRILADEDEPTNYEIITQFMDDMKATDPPDGGVSARDNLWGTHTPGETLITFIDEDINQNLVTLNNSKVTNLSAKWPLDGAPAGTVFTFWSEAETEMRNGAIIQRNAYMHVNFRNDLLLTVPGGIMSGGTVSANGHFNLHWGDAWSKTGIKLHMKVKHDTRNPPRWRALADHNQVADQWTKYRVSMGYIKDKEDTIAVNDQDIYDVGAYEQGPKYDNHLYQYEDLHTPPGEEALSQKIDKVINTYATSGNSDTGYEFWKSVAIQRDTYFRENYNGEVVNENGDQLYLKDGKVTTSGGTPLTVESALEYYRSLPEVYLIFFDTKDGNPPVTDGTRSNWADIRFSGSISSRSKGLFYIAGNLFIGGSGRPPSIKIRNPDEVIADIDPSLAETEAPVFHDGIIFTFGDYVNQGNPIVYGAVVTNSTYHCGGTPNLFYNEALRNGEPFQISNPVRILVEVLPSGVK